MGTAAQNGELWSSHARDWAELQEGQARAVYQAVFDDLRVREGTRLLDAGCGSGLAAQIAAARGAQVAGLDAAAGLLAIARERTPAGDFRQGELEELPFADASFDAVTGFNSFQFAADVPRALREAVRVVRPGGAVAVLTWGPPEGMPVAAIVNSLRPLAPPPPPGAPGPFALSTGNALSDLLAAQGLEPELLRDVPFTLRYTDLETGVRGLNSSGVAERVMRHAGVEAVANAHREALRPFVQPDGSCAVAALFRYVIARRG